jgi:hypothetical protein
LERNRNKANMKGYIGSFGLVLWEIDQVNKYILILIKIILGS